MIPIPFCLVVMLGGQVTDTMCKDIDAKYIAGIVEICHDRDMPDHKGDDCTYSLVKRGQRYVHTFIVTAGGRV